MKLLGSAPSIQESGGGGVNLKVPSVALPGNVPPEGDCYSARKEIITPSLYDQTREILFLGIFRRTLIVSMKIPDLSESNELYTLYETRSAASI